MIGKSHIAGLAVAAAMSGLVGGAALMTGGCKSPGASGGASSTNNTCKAGANACKGQGACKTANNACNGQNACKGQGGGAK